MNTTPANAAMTNRRIAEVLREIAALLEIKGENVFKVRAYQKAADTITNLTEEVASLRARGELRNLPGIGASISDTIEELFTTGTSKHLDELLHDFPATLLDIMRIPEVGPKTVQLLYKTLNIATIEDLEAAAQAGQLREIRGLGAKTEDNILKGIARVRRFSERFPIAVAYPVVMEIVAALRKKVKVKQLEVAGSLRRMQETIGDLDLLATSADAEQVMQAFVELPLVREVIARGPTKTSLIVDTGIQVDLRVVEPDAFGAALLYFTGSKTHNIKLRELALKRGLTINEYSISEVDGGKVRGGATEAEIYAALDLPWIPPEIREDTGEIEAAQHGKLPQLIEDKDIRGDLHVHSTWSDGKNSIADMAAAALARGYAYIAISDHSPGQIIANGLAPERLRARQQEIISAREQFPDLTILAGTEVDIKTDGSLDYPDEVLAELDFVIASIHSGWKAPREANTARMIKAISHPLVDAIGHPTGRLIGARDPYEIDMEAVLQAAAQAGVAMEVDASPDRLDLKDTHIRRARELGVKLVINTDAHHADNYDLLHFGVATARRGWTEAKDVINTFPRAKFLAARRSHKLRKRIE
jgi:DNA polymerase (family X)